MVTVVTLVFLGVCILAIFFAVLMNAVRLAVDLSTALDALRSVRRLCTEAEYIAAYDLSNDALAEIDYTLGKLSKKERS